MHNFQHWESFYLIVGGAAGALIGLQFVVMTLIADRPTTTRGVRAFTTPTVVHFVTVLVLAAIASAPWPNMGLLAIVWGIIGVAGVLYGLVVGRHMRRQDVHAPTAADWLLHLLLPSFAYLVLILSSAMVGDHTLLAIWLAAFAALLLLLVGVRSSWGVISYHATGAGRDT